MNNHNPSLSQMGLDARRALQEGRFSEALSLFEQVSSAHHCFETLHTMLALAALQCGEYHKVLPAIKRELSAYPESPSARALLEDIDKDCARNPLLQRPLSEGQRILLAGLPPDSSGTGRFLEALIPVALERGFSLVHPILGGRFGFGEKVRLSGIRNSELLILHPQTIGWPLVAHLLEAGNRVSMYVLDNSFFCIRSYNYREDSVNECLDCVGDLSRCHHSCQPFPAGVSKCETLQSMKSLQDHAARMNFFCQSEVQRRLVLKHFGSVASAHVVGMKTAELVSLVTQPAFDIVYHAEELAAKGFWYTIELAQNVPELRILIPSSREAIERTFGAHGWPTNVIFRALRWESGLAEAVRRCGLVLCPSLWSAAVEGALLKSLYENGSVAVVESEFGFSSEMPPEIVLTLSRSPSMAATQLREYWPTLRRARGQRWTTQYLNSVQLEKMFDVLDQSRGDI
jgi:hypothetical protein